jgi:hypothetical protein
VWLLVAWFSFGAILTYTQLCSIGELYSTYGTLEKAEVERYLKKKMISQDVQSTGSVGKLLSTPNVNLTESVYSRVNCSFKNLSERFGHHLKDYTRQFSHMYAVRLTKMKGLLTKRIHHKWGNV